ncbi:MAG TPA: tripartite tricarboxylate transporter TctB family protein [Rectinemataceae bacterium]
MVKRAYQATAIGCIVFAIAIMAGSLELQFYTKLGPGPGFFPFILASIFGVLSIVWLIQSTVRKTESGSKRFLPDKHALIRISAIAAGLLGVSLLMEPLGYQLTMFIFLFSLITLLGKRKILEAAIVSILGSVGVFYLFGKVLGLILPTSSIAFLAAIGL